MAVSRMRNEKYAIWPLLVAESPMNSKTGQIPCSTERIYCIVYELCFYIYYFQSRNNVDRYAGDAKFLPDELH